MIFKKGLYNAFRIIICLLVSLALAAGTLFPTPKFHIQKIEQAQAIAPVLPWVVQAFWTLCAIVGGCVAVGTVEQQTGLISQSWTEFLEWCQTEKGLTAVQVEGILNGSKMSDGEISLLSLQAFIPVLNEWITEQWENTVTDSSQAVSATGQVLTLANGISFTFTEQPLAYAISQIQAATGITNTSGLSTGTVHGTLGYWGTGNSYVTNNVTVSGTTSNPIYIKMNTTDSSIVYIKYRNIENMIPNQITTYSNGTKETSWYYDSQCFNNAPVYLDIGTSYGNYLIGYLTGDTFTVNSIGQNLGLTSATAVTLSGASIGRVEGATGYVDSDTKSVAIYIPDTEDTVINYPDIESGTGAVAVNEQPNYETNDLLSALLSGLLSLPSSIADALEGLRINADEMTSTTPEAALTMLTNQISSKFPFCIPADIKAIVSKFSKTADAPSIEFDFTVPVFGTITHVNIDLEEWTSAAQTVKTLLSVAVLISLGFLAVSYLGLINGNTRKGEDA